MDILLSCNKTCYGHVIVLCTGHVIDLYLDILLIRLARRGVAGLLVLSA